MSEAVEKYVKEYAKVCAKKYAKEYAKKYAKEYTKEYAKEYASAQKAKDVKNLMESTGFTMEQALNALKIQDEEREYIVELIFHRG